MSEDLSEQVPEEAGAGDASATRRLRLRRIELHGFKSFADPTDFDFEPGITGIVGPNGCGKSNVVDALKWVLGEQRPTSVRGSGMLDVIFKGARGRASAEFADVTLHLETSEPESKGDGENGSDDAGRGSTRVRPSRTSIGRRLKADGESAYFFDGTGVRLKDVRSHLLDTGLGVRAYSVLEQGKIDAVLDANPLARRAIFEEAAGISRFRLQRREANSKLERTQVNLEKVEERLDEMRRRINSLKRQAGRARRYITISDRLKELRLSTGVLRLREVMYGIERGGEKLTSEERTVERLRRERSGREEEGHVLERQLQRLGEAMEQVRRRLAGVRGEESSLDERRALLTNNLELERRRARDLIQQAEAQGGEITGLSAQVEELEGQLAERRGHETAAEAELEALASGLVDARAHLTHARRENDRLEEARFEATQSRAGASNRLHALQGQIDSAGQREERIRERLAELEKSEELLAAEATRFAEQEGEARGRQEELHAQIEVVGDRRERADRERQELMAERLELRTQRASVEARKEALEALERELEGFDPGTRALVEQQSASGAEESEASGCAWAARLSGLLVDRIHAPSEVARAVESALGASLTAVMVADLASARAAIEWLRAQRLGRASFVVPAPTEQIAGSTLDPARIDAASRQPGVNGRLIEHLRVDEDARQLVEALLADVWLIASASHVEEALSALPGARLVTAEGELYAGGEVLRAVGGFLEEGSGIVSRKSTLEELSVELANLNGQLERTEGALESVNAELDEVDGLRADLARSERELQREVEQLRSSCARAEAHLARHREEVTLVKHDLTELGGQLEGLRTDLQEAQGSLDQRSAELAEVEGELKENYQQLEEARATYESSQQREHRVRLSIKELQGERRTVEESLAGVSRSLKIANRRVAELGEEQELAEQRACSAETQIGGLENERNTLRAQCEQLEEEIAGRSGEVEGRRREFEAHRLRTESVQAKLERLLEGIQETRLHLQESEHRRADLCNRIKEDYQLELVDVLKERQELGDIVELGEEELDEAEGEIVVLRKDLERIGGVNLEAVAELDEVQAEYDEIRGNCEDLRAAKRKLEETIEYLDRESRVRFLQTFEAVRANFQKLFRRLFNGGRADIELIGEGDDPLEKGIEVKARPAGKSLQTVGLLSGGERTLTALAILFSMFMVKPSPFCLLDEVDAALDDANVQRFCALLDEFEDDTQFVIVTHNKYTMARCHVLYGVTMQNTGVSHRVSVRWDQVDEDGRFESREPEERDVILEPQPRAAAERTVP